MLLKSFAKTALPMILCVGLVGCQGITWDDSSPRFSGGTVTPSVPSQSQGNFSSGVTTSTVAPVPVFAPSPPPPPPAPVPPPAFSSGTTTPAVSPPPAQNFSAGVTPKAATTDKEKEKEEASPSTFSSGVTH